SLLSRDISITSLNIDFLPEEFGGELDLIDPILPGIDEDNFNEEEGVIDIDILQIEDEILREKLLNVNHLIDSDFIIEEVDTFLVSEDSIPPGEGEIVFSQNVEEDDSFIFVIWTFLPFLTYPEDSPLLLSIGSEDTIFEPAREHLRDLYLDNSSHAIDAFKPAFHTFFGEEHETFRFKMFYNLDQLRLQLERENLHEVKEGSDTEDAVIRPVNDQVPLVESKDVQMQEGKVDMESSGTMLDEQDTSSMSRNDADTEDAVIRPVNDQVPLVEVQLTVQHDTLVNEQQHSVQSEPIYDTHLLEKVDRNTIPDSTNMCHRGGEIEQNAEKCQVSCPLLDPSFDNMTTEFSNQSLESENIFLKKTVAQLQKDFSRMETHCVNMELKYQNQALKDGQHGQILNETSNKAKINKEIEVLEKINIELEHSVAKLLADNEKLHKENEHLKQTYKDLYDSIKTTRVQTKDHNDSLIAQINSKTVENADLKAQIQEKVFANVALKNELRKLKGNSVDTKFAKPSILGKPVLQPPRNQSVVRQPNAFKSKRPNFSKPRFASQVDVNNILSKPVTQHYLPKGREYAFAKSNHRIASSSSRNSSKNMPRFSSNDMVHNYYLEEAKKKTQERDRKSTTSVMPSAKSQNTTKSCKSKPRSNNQTSRVLPTSKSSCPTTTVMPKADHSRNSSPFSDFKHFVCSTCQKCVFNANHDACITKFLKEVNSRAKIQPNKTRNSNKPVDPTSHTQKPGRKIVTGHSFSPNKSSAVHEKTNTPRSYLRWIPTGRIFNTAGLKWVPTGTTFTSSTTKVDCELPNGSNDCITNPYKHDQTLNVSAGTLNLSAGTFCNPEKERLRVCLLKKVIYQKPRVPGIYAPLLKEKKSVRFSALFLQKKRNLLNSILQAGNPVKKILLKLNLSDHRLFKDGGGVKEFQRSFRHSDTERLSRSDEVLKLKNFKKDAALKLSKSTNQERYEHVGPEVASSQDGKVSRWRRDYAWSMISSCSRSQCQIQVQGTSSIQKSMITTTYSQEKVKSTS
ncbi:hypothetical protein Tco_0580520, partial [Tanacetum coccineum]